MQKPSVVLAVVLVGCGFDDASTAVDELPDELRGKAADAMWIDLAARQERTFIVALQPTVTDSATRIDHKARLRAVAPSSELVFDHDWSELPLVQVRATTLDAAVALLERDEVAAAYEIEHYEMTDAQSFPLIGQPTAAAAGKVGAGTTVAVLDTGTDYTRPDFGSCTSPGVPATCKVAFAADFAPADNTPDDHGHGTNVSGIVLGVAPSAKVLALDVFDGASASSTDIISAINWAIANKAPHNIAAMNLSLGGGSSTTTCTTNAMGIALGAARSAGIAPVVASGNSATANALSSPACAPAAISVGAVYDANVGGLSFSNCSNPTTVADQVTCFSNSASFLTLLAPGALITAGGYTMAGTSQAAPHVAGAFAVLRGAFPAESVDQQLARLTSTGKPILDPRNAITKPRIDLAAAVATASADTTPPTGAVKISGGAVATNVAAVTLAIAASDASGMGQMCVTNTSACTTFETFSPTKAWTLAAGNGTKTVTVVLRDKLGNTTTAATSPKASIVLDAMPPTNGTATATSGNKAITLRWAGFSDAGSGIATYRVVFSTGTTAPATCAGATVFAGTATTFTHTGLVNGAAVSYRVCARDAAGNLSTGTSTTATPHELAPPIGTLVINSGAANTRVLAVNLALAATDETRVAQMCVTTATTCSAFVTYAPAMTYTLAAGDGMRTLRVWYRDSWGNTSAPVAASIRVDTRAPTGGVLTATAAIAKINLSWTAATDAGSGVAGYRLVGIAGTTAPATCTIGATLSTGTATSFAHSVASAATWSYRLCAVDVAGNVAVGTTKTIAAR